MIKKINLLAIIMLTAFISLNAQEVANSDKNAESSKLDLPGDNLDLYATLDLFQKSKTIEEFEKSLNDKEVGINNLDLDADGNVDFIKVETKQDKDDFTFILQVDVVKDDIQDVAVILVSKDEKDKVTIQMVGDEDLYGKDYVIEPKLKTEAVTANPAYSGADTVKVVSQEATVVVVESAPIVHYVYSPMYAPYYPPYYYGYYPPYYRPYPVVSFHIYFGHHHHHHNHYHGGRHGGGNTVIINNNKTYNNYNKNRKTSKTVKNNRNNGAYKSQSTSKKSSINKSQKSNTKKNKSQNLDKGKNIKPKTNSIPSNSKVSKPSTRTSRPASRPRTSGVRRR